MHLTNKEPIRSDALATSGSASDATGAPANEIEITPEMINEGVRLLMNYDPDFSNERDIAMMIINIGLLANRNALESGL